MKSVVTGRCYCGATQFQATQKPIVVAYCHCSDCRRVTGAPVAAFAAFDEKAVSLTPSEGKSVTINPGVIRTFCESCGTPLTGRYDYLPGSVYIAMGILDQAEQYAPELHCHDAMRLPWINIDDDYKRCPGSARGDLNDA